MISQAISIKRNSLFSFLSTFSRIIANFIVFWVLARYYGPETFGQFTFSITLATTFLFLADFGFDVLLTTEIAKDKDRAVQILQQLLPLKLVFISVAVIGMWLFANFFSVSTSSRILVFIFGFYLIISSLVNFLNAFFKGFERLELETKVSLISNFVLMVFACLLILFRANVVLIALSFLVSRIVGLIIGLRFMHQLSNNLKLGISFRNLSEIRAKVAVFGIHFLFNFLYFQIDTIILAIMKGDYYVGIYQAVFKLIALALVIPEILNNVLLPALSRLNIENVESWKRVGYLMNKMLLIIGFPITIILFVYSDQIIEFVYGTGNYLEAVPILKIFSIVLLIRFSMESLSLMLTTSNRQKIRMYTVLVATVINVTLNIIYVPIFGVIAVAVISAITNGIVLLIYYIVSIPLSTEWILNRNTMSLFLLASISFGILWETREMNFIIGGLMVIIFFTLISFKFFFSKEERKLFFSRDIKFFFIKNNLSI